MSERGFRLRISAPGQTNSDDSPTYSPAAYDTLYIGGKNKRMMRERLLMRSRAAGPVSAAASVQYDTPDQGLRVGVRLHLRRCFKHDRLSALAPALAVAARSGSERDRSASGEAKNGLNVM